MKSLVICFVYITILWSLPARAENPFDGVWEFRPIVTEGPCANPRFYTTLIRIKGGHIGTADDKEAISINGRVKGDGTLHAKAVNSVDVAEGEGFLSGDNGSGTWVSTSKGCKGTWTVLRREK